MRRLIVTVSVLGALAFAAIAAIGGGTAEAGVPPNKCPETPPFDVPGPEICTFSFTDHRELPAGTRCDFDVTIDIEWQGTIYFFANPPRAVAHMVSVGTVNGNGHTLVRTARFTETASPEIVFTDHGLLARYSMPGGRTVTMFAGYQRESIVPPEPFVFHGNPPLDWSDMETAAFCAALT
jgi:hypothetical protein